MTHHLGRATTYDLNKRELIGPSKKKRTLSRGKHKFMMCLLKKPNEMIPKEDFLAVFSGDENKVCVYATRLRDTLEIVDPSLSIENKYGKGYTLKGVVRSI